MQGWRQIDPQGASLDQQLEFLVQDIAIARAESVFLTHISHTPSIHTRVPGRVDTLASKIIHLQHRQTLPCSKSLIVAHNDL